VPTRVRLPTLLSQALVAFTLEFDNEFEHRMPHRTTRPSQAAGWSQLQETADGRQNRRLWLVSMAMWCNCLQFVGEDWMPVAEMDRLARTATNLDGMRRWRYIDVEPQPDDRRSKPPRGDLLVRITAGGMRAKEVLRPLGDIIEARWRERFGAAVVDELRSSLAALVSQLDGGLPDCMPILHFGLVTNGPAATRTAAGADVSVLPLSALLARPLVAFAMDFERESALSLAIVANVLRVLDDTGIRVRDLPRLSGVSKEAISMATGFLEKRRYAIEEPDPAASRGKVVRLTAKGRMAQLTSRELLERGEARWVQRFGADTIADVRSTLEPIVVDPEGGRSPLFAGIEPYPDGWRASIPQPEMLPYFPMVLHRGGYPDGS
jgi:DNA-binding MarR family transcriptional regulator